MLLQGEQFAADKDGIDLDQRVLVREGTPLARGHE